MVTTTFQPSSGLSDIVIADRISDANQRRIRGTSNLQVSWELSYAGQLSCELPLLDLRQYGFQPLDLLARWIHYEHPTAGPWGGVITNVAARDGIVTINAESWAAELKGVPTSRSLAGSFTLIAELRHQIDLVRGDTGILPGLFALGSVDPAISDWAVDDGQDLYESFLPEVLSRWEQAESGAITALQAYGWNVDPVTRKFNFDGSYGFDRSQSVLLLDGFHNTSSEYSDDLEDVINRVYISGTVNYQYTESVPYRNNRGQLGYQQIIHSGRQTHHAAATNETSRGRYGLRSLSLQEDHPSAAAIDAAALERVGWLARTERPVSIETADVGGVWSRFREGDIVGVGLGNSGAWGRMVVRSRALDVARGTMRVAGEAELG